MEFFYDFAWLPVDRELLMDINSAAKRLFRKLKVLNVHALDISDYNREYLGSYLARLTSSLQLYSYVLSLSLVKFRRALAEFCFLDYGGGCGMLSMLAKELGIGTVIYNDIYDVSCRDAEVIAESLKNEADYYVKGDVEDVLQFLNKHNLSCHAVASYDVIEHIYDIESFAKRIACTSDGPMTLVMASGANICNPIVVGRIAKRQIDAEFYDREKKWGHKERDCLRSYLGVRREMVIEHLLDCDRELAGDEIELLARNTRGMIEADIRRSVDHYLKTKRFPQPPRHPTNTCDPYTGNWMEHLMDQSYLVGLLSKGGFSVRILSGYYGRSGNARVCNPKDCLKCLLNIAIRLLRSQGTHIAPYFTVYARRGLPMRNASIRSTTYVSARATADAQEANLHTKARSPGFTQTDSAHLVCRKLRMILTFVSGPNLHNQGPNI